MRRIQPNDLSQEAREKLKGRFLEVVADHGWICQNGCLGKDKFKVIY